MERQRLEDKMTRVRMTLNATAIMAAFLLLTLGASVASADTVNYSINTSGGTLPGSIEYATATVTFINATTADITITSSNPSKYLIVDGDAVSLTVKGPGRSLSIFS